MLECQLCEGLIIDDEAALAKLVTNICYGNSARRFIARPSVRLQGTEQADWIFLPAADSLENCDRRGVPK